MSIEAMKQALEVLQYIDGSDNKRNFLWPNECYQLDEAITALRTAIAEAEKQEPVALLVDEARMALFEAINKRDEYGLAALTDDKLILQRLRENGFWIGRLNTPPAQRQWVGLTDEEISASSKGHITRNGFARAVEAKLKEKNT